MTILMIGQKGLPARSGGIEQHVESLSKGLVARGHRVVVFGRRWYVGQAVAPHGIEQVCTPGLCTKHLDAITHSFTALLAARRFRPDVLHLHGVGIALLAPLARLLYPKAKLVITFHCMDRRFSKWGKIARAAFWLGEWFTCAFAHEIVTVSQELQRYCNDAYGRRAQYVSHAFRFQGPGDRAQAEARVRALGLEPYRYFLFVGRLIPHKGPHRLLEAFVAAKRQYPDAFSGLQAAIVGGSSFTDAYLERLQPLFAMTPDAFALGERFDGELRALQSCALGHVFPSLEEGLSLAVLEASSTGRPVVMHDIQANREATGGYAHTVDVAQPGALIDSLFRLATASEEARQAQGRALSAYVAQAFDATKNIDAMDRLYRDLVLDNEELVSVSTPTLP